MSTTGAVPQGSNRKNTSGVSRRSRLLTQKNKLEKIAGLMEKGVAMSKSGGNFKGLSSTQIARINKMFKGR